MMQNTRARKRAQEASSAFALHSNNAPFEGTTTNQAQFKDFAFVYVD